MSWKETPSNYYSNNPLNPHRYKRKIHQKNPLLWFKERWKASPKDIANIKWSLYKEYENHEWDGSVDPLFSMWDSLARQQFTCGVSATGTGKTYLSALIIYWFLDVFPDAVIVVSSTKFSQLKRTMFAELKRQFPKFKKLYPEATWSENLEIKIDIVREDKEGKPMDSIDCRKCYGSTESVGAGESIATGASGIHSPNMLIILDELAGIPPAVLNSYINTCTSANNVILGLGNPKSQTDSLHQFSQLPSVTDFRLSALDHPNLVTDRGGDVIPGAVSQATVDRRLAEYISPDHPLYLAMVRGICPATSVDSIIQMRELKKCYNVAPEIRLKWRSRKRGIGVDVANSVTGDKAAVAVFEDNVLTFLKDFTCPDASAIAYNMLKSGEELEKYLAKFRDGLNRRYEIPNLYDLGFEDWDVAVDVTGVGSSTVNAFLYEDWYVQSFIAAGKVDTDMIPKNLDTGLDMYSFNNTRSFAFWLLMQDIQRQDISFDIPADVFHALCLELCAFRRSQSPTARYFQLENKFLTSRRIVGKASPNLSDAVIMANWVRHRNLLGIGGGSHSFVGVHI